MPTMATAKPIAFVDARWEGEAAGAGLDRAPDPSDLRAAVATG